MEEYTIDITILINPIAKAVPPTYNSQGFVPFCLNPLVFVYGIYILWVNWDYSEDKNGLVLSDSVCTSTTVDGRPSQSCNTTFSFKDSTGKSYTATQPSLSYKKGDTVVVFYKDSDPMGTCKLDFWTKSFGYFFIGGGVLFAALSWGWVYLVEKFKPLAAFSGAKGIFDVVKTF